MLLAIRMLILWLSNCTFSVKPVLFFKSKYNNLANQYRSVTLNNLLLHTPIMSQLTFIGCYCHLISSTQALLLRRQFERYANLSSTLQLIAMTLFRAIYPNTIRCGIKSGVYGCLFAHKKSNIYDIARLRPRTAFGVQYGREIWR